MNKDAKIYVAGYRGLVGSPIVKHGYAANTHKPVGTPKKLIDVSRLHALGWKVCTLLEKDLTLAYQDYVNHLGHKLQSMAA